MRKKLRTAIVAAAVALLAAPAAFAFIAEAARDRASTLLEEIRAAQDRVRFAGRKIVDTPEGQSVFDLRADRPGRVHAEPVVRPTGRRSTPWMGRAARGRFSDPDLITENYRLEARGHETVAGRSAERYALLPRHAGRSTYEFAVDRQNRFVLAFRATSADGTRLYDARFESITFDLPPRTEEKTTKPPQARPAGSRRVSRERVAEKDLRGAMDFAVWMPRWTPPGFKLKSLERYVIPNLGEAIMARWSDGMAGIHIIQMDAANPSWELFRGAYLGLPEAPPTSAEAGGPVAWRMRTPGGALLDLALDGTEVLIGGQVDPDELKKMADHLRNIESPPLR